MSAIVVNIHLGGLVVVQLLPDVGFILWCEPSPGLVRPSVVFVARRHFDIVVELDYFSSFEFIHTGSKTKFSQQVPFLLLPIQPGLVVVFSFKDVSLLELLWRRPERESAYQLRADDTSVDLSLLLRHLVKDVPIYELLPPRPLFQLG